MIVVNSGELVYLIHIIVPAGGEVSKEASNSLCNIPAYFLIVAPPRPHEHLHAIRRGAEYLSAHSPRLEHAKELSTLSLNARLLEPGTRTSSRNARISPPKSHETA